MSTITDIVALINQLANENVRIAQQAKELLAKNQKLKAQVAELEGKKKGPK